MSRYVEPTASSLDSDSESDQNEDQSDLFIHSNSLTLSTQLLWPRIWSWHLITYLANHYWIITDLNVLYLYSDPGIVFNHH